MFAPAKIGSALAARRPNIRLGRRGQNRPDLDRLAAVLLAHGGEGHQVPSFLRAELTASFVAALLAKGLWEKGDTAILRPGMPNRCHDNARQAASTDIEMVHMSGLALSADGIWRVHSWLVDSHHIIIETTVRRTLYFGLPAADDNALHPRRLRRLTG
jgi:hypothetical protein